MNILGYFNEEDNKFHLIKADSVSGTSHVVDRLKEVKKIKVLCDNGINIIRLKNVDVPSEDNLATYNEVATYLDKHGLSELKFNYLQNNIVCNMTQFNIDEWIGNDCNSLEVTTDKLIFTYDYFKDLFPNDYDTRYQCFDSPVKVFLRYNNNIYYVTFDNEEFAVYVYDKDYEDLLSGGLLTLNKKIKEGMYHD